MLHGRMERAARAKAPVVGIEVLRTFVPLLRWGLLLVAVAVALEMLKLPPPVEEWLGHGVRAALAVLAAFVAGGAAGPMSLMDELLAPTGGTGGGMRLVESIGISPSLSRRSRRTGQAAKGPTYRGW